MFEHTLAVPVRANRAYATMLGFATQSLLLTTAITIPMMFPDSLPRIQTVIGIFTPAPPPPPPPAGQPQAPASKARPIPLTKGIFTEPSRVPPKIVLIDEPPLTAAEMGIGVGNKFGVVGGSDNGIVGGTPFSIGTEIAAPRPAVAPKPEPVVVVKPAPTPKIPVKVGGDVQEAKLLHRVIPAYPPLAKQARVSGIVQLTGWIAADGRIRELRVLSGHPLLVSAAVDAVKQWVYRPTHLNGEPVEVIAPISVHFILN